MWVNLEKAKKEEVECPELKFVPDFRMHHNISAVLSLERQLDDVVNFCTNPKEFSVFSNGSASTCIFSSSVNAPKERLKNLFSFCKLFVTEKSEFSSLLAYATDGKKVIVDGFKRNVPFTTFLRCFMHYKKNIEEHLENCGFSKDLKKLFLKEIFGVQNSDKKLCGLVDCSSEEEFD